MKLYTNCIVALIAAFSFNLCPAFATPTDFDNDGRSELVSVTIQSNSSLSWSTYNLESAQSSTKGTLGSAGNNLTLANWLSASQPSLGVITINANNDIIWRILASNSTVIERAFGKKGNLSISGADFNGDGITDAAVARIVSKKALWSFGYNLFTSSIKTRADKNIYFGSDLTKIFYARPKAGKDWLGTIVKNRNKTYSFQFKDLTNGKVTTSRAIPSFFNSLGKNRPVPVRQANGTDIIVAIRARGAQTQLDFYKTTGTRVTTAKIPSSGDVVVGDFTSAPGEEVAVKNADSTQMLVFSPITKKTVSMEVKKGIAVDSININTVTVASTPPIKPTPTPTTPGSNKPIPKNGETITCSNIVDLNSLSNFLYKNENVHGGRGRSALDQGHRNGGVRTLLVAGLDGTVFGCFGLYRCDQPFGCRYYQAMCGDTSSNSQFIAKAKKYGAGSTKALISAGKGGTCYQFQADAARYGNIIK